MTKVLVDTGPLVAAADVADKHHRRCREYFEQATADLLVLPTVIAETCHMLGRHGRSDVESAFLRSVARGDFALTEILPSDLERAAELVEQYADMGLGGTDSTIVAVAERLSVRTVATIDVRHFSVVRPRHCRADGLVLVP